MNNDELARVIKTFKIALYVAVGCLCLCCIIWSIVAIVILPHVVQASLNHYFADYTETP